MHTLPRNSAGHPLFLFFTSFTRSKSALCHLLCEATCLTDKQLGNVTSVVEYSKIVTAQQLGDRTTHIIHIFLRFMHISRLKCNSWIEKTYLNDNLNFFQSLNMFLSMYFISYVYVSRQEKVETKIQTFCFHCWNAM